MISVCILTKNSAKTLSATLESTRLFREVLLLDNGSTDETLSLAQEYPNVHIHHSPFLGFGVLRNLAATKALCDWILALDSDEVLSPALLQEIDALSLQESSCIYSLRRRNFYQGREIFGCGWSPDWVERLYHRTQTSFGNQRVHESLQKGPGQCIPLHHPLLHTPYRSTEEFLAKMQHYSTLFAEEQAGKRHISFAGALGHSAFAFLKSYFLQKGLFDGKEGFFLSLYNANCTFYKYMKLLERNRREGFK